MNKNQETFGFIGCGNMGASLIGGLLKSEYRTEQIIGCDADEEIRQSIQSRLKIQVTANNSAIIDQADVIVLCVKPQVMETVLKSLAHSLTEQQLLISVAAGIPLSAIANWAGQQQAIVRVMPNTPALIGAGISGLCANHHVSEEQKKLADDMMTSVGTTLWLKDEALIDAITAVSGSGPAYFFRVMEAMEQAAMMLGLSAEEAARLTRQTAYGAAMMVKETGESPASLREKVTSPGGTTERALNILDEKNIEQIFINALKGARDRSIELGNEYGESKE